MGVSLKRLFCIAKLLIFCCLTSSALGTTYYIDFTPGVGNDGNSGIDKAHPWKRCPGMATFGGTYTHAAGDHFIFKGGVTWPAACFPLTVRNGGSSQTNRDYYGVDQTWFTGGSWTRPLFDWAQVTVTGIVVNSAFIQIDNLEMANMKSYARNNFGQAYVLSNADYTQVSNCLIRDWVPFSPALDDSFVAVLSNSGVGMEVTHCEFTQQGRSYRSGITLYNISYPNFNHIHHVSNAILGFGDVHDNHIHNIGPPSDPASHCNAILIQGGSGGVYNNLIHDLDSTSTCIDFAPTSGGSFGWRAWNNVMWNTGGQYDIQNDNHATATTSFKAWNNTIGPGGVLSADKNSGGVEFVNNHVIGAVGGGIGNIRIDTGSTIVANNHNLTPTEVVATAAGYTVANAYQPTSGAAPTVNVGSDISAVFTTDRLGVTRPQGGTWDIGAYEYNGGGGGPTPTPVPTPHMTISSTAPVYFGSVQASGTTSDKTWTITNDGGTGTTLSWSVSGLSSPWSFVGSTSGSLALNASATVTGRYRPTAKANDSATITFSDGTNTQTAAVTGICYPNLGTLNPLLTVNANAGILTAPFADHAGDVYQTSETDDPTQGGRLSFGFTVPTAGQYKISGLMNCPDGGTNSFFINVDGEPTAPTMISDIVNVTTGFESRDFPWRGNGGFDSPQFNPNLFTLTTGDHQLVIRGREANAKLRTITISPISTPPPALNATFSVSPQGGTEPLVASFTAQGISGVPPYTYLIHFDDGSGDSTSQSTTHNYSAGTYHAVSTVSDSAPIPQTKSVTTTIVVDALTAFSVAAGASVTSGTEPLTVNLTATPTGGLNPDTYFWVISNGTTSTSQNPSVVLSAGTYTATVTAKDAYSPAHTATDSKTITVSGAPALDFDITATPSTGIVPFDVAFALVAPVSGGDGGPYTYSWRSGEAAPVGTGTSFSHNYKVAGPFSGALTVQDSSGHSRTVSTLIQANAPAPSFSAVIFASTASGPAPLTVGFNSVLSGTYTGPVSYLWDFEDDTQSTEATPVHVYTAINNFMVTLTVTDANGLTAGATGHLVTTLPGLPKSYMILAR